ncbi:MAG: protease [Thermoprotei archaeon]|nr:MAG: protease [Thermoprotei archaeon]
MGMLMLLLMLMASLAALALGINVSQAIAFALLMSIPLNLLVYYYSDQIVLAMTRAKLVDESEAPLLHRIVERVAMRAGIPKPRVAIVPTDVPNAFATGRSPEKAVVAVTRGAIRLLSEDELEAVIGHEISHVKHRDVLVATMAAVIASAIGWLAYTARWGAIFSYGDREERGSTLVLLLASILVPIFAAMIQMAISRAREYKADEGSAYITRKPHALISALQRIENYVRRKPETRMNPSTSCLWIVNPFRGSSLEELFSTHPPTWKRIERLRRIAREMGLSI